MEDAELDETAVESVGVISCGVTEVELSLSNCISPCSSVLAPEPEENIPDENMFRIGGILPVTSAYPVIPEAPTPNIIRNSSRNFCSFECLCFKISPPLNKKADVRPLFKTLRCSPLLLLRVFPSAAGPASRMTTAQ